MWISNPSSQRKCILNDANTQSDPKRISRDYQKNKCSKREGGDKKRGTENTQRNRGEKEVS